MLVVVLVEEVNPKRTRFSDDVLEVKAHAFGPEILVATHTPRIPVVIVVLVIIINKRSTTSADDTALVGV